MGSNRKVLIIYLLFQSFPFKRLPWSLKNIEKLKETANELLNFCDE